MILRILLRDPSTSQDTPARATAHMYAASAREDIQGGGCRGNTTDGGEWAGRDDRSRTHTQTHTQRYRHTHTHARAEINTYTHTHTHARTHTHTHARAPTRTHPRPHTCAQHPARSHPLARGPRQLSPRAPPHHHAHVRPYRVDADWVPRARAMTPLARLLRVADGCRSARLLFA